MRPNQDKYGKFKQISTIMKKLRMAFYGQHRRIKPERNKDELPGELKTTQFNV